MRRQYIALSLGASLCPVWANVAKATEEVGLTFDVDGDLMLQRTGESDVKITPTSGAFDSMGSTLEYQLNTAGPEGYQFTSGENSAENFGSSDWIIDNASGQVQDAILFTNVGGFATIFVYQPNGVVPAGDLAKTIAPSSPKYSNGGLIPSTAYPSGGTAAQILSYQLALQQTRSTTQTVTINGSPTGGTFTLTVPGHGTTGPILFNAPPNGSSGKNGSGNWTNVEQALAAIGLSSADVAVTQPIVGDNAFSGPYSITFYGSLLNNYLNQPFTITANASGLTGGSSPSIAISALPTLSNYFTQSLITSTSGGTQSDSYTINQVNGASGPSMTNGTLDTIGSVATSPVAGVSQTYGALPFYSGGTNNLNGFATAPSLNNYATTTGEIYSYDTGSPNEPGSTKYTGIDNMETIVTFEAAVPLPNTAATMAVLLGGVGSFGYWRSNKRRTAHVA